MGLKPSELADSTFLLCTSEAQRTDVLGVCVFFLSPKLELSCLGQVKVKSVKGKWR